MIELEQKITQILKIQQNFETESRNLRDGFFEETSPEGKVAPWIFWLYGFIDEHTTLKTEIYETSVKNSSIVVSKKLSPEKFAVLRKIQNGQPVGIEQTLGKDLLKAFSAHKPDIDDIWFNMAETDEEVSAAHELDFPVNPLKFLADTLEIGSLVLREGDGTSALHSIVDEARNCFAFGQYRAVYALSRAALEFTCRGLCERLGMIDGIDDKVTELWPYGPDDINFEKMIRAVCTDDRLSSTQHRLHDVRIQCNKVIHVRTDISRDDAKSILRQTLGAIHQIFDRMD